MGRVSEIFSIPDDLHTTYKPEERDRESSVYVPLRKMPLGKTLLRSQHHRRVLTKFVAMVPLSEIIIASEMTAKPSFAASESLNSSYDLKGRHQMKPCSQHCEHTGLPREWWAASRRPPGGNSGGSMKNAGVPLRGCDHSAAGPYKRGSRQTIPSRA